MQLIGKDTVVESWVGSEGQILHKTTAGFQFGTGRERQIVTSLEQVSNFHPDVQAKVADWLGANGVREAEKHLMDREVSEKASEAPGTLDAMAAQLGQETKAQLFHLLKSALENKVGGITPPAPAAEAPIVEDENGIKHRLPDPELAKHPRVIPTDGGVLLDKGHGHKEFVPSDDMADDLDEEKAMIAAQEGRKKSTKKR